MYYQPSDPILFTDDVITTEETDRPDNFHMLDDDSVYTII